MAATFLDIAITPDVMDVQHEMGSDSLWQTPRSRRQADRFGDSEAGMIATRDSFYLATVSQSGWPYIQHRGGPPGFLHLLDDTTLAMADFGGNRQYITTGNLRGSDRACLFLMDYPRRARLKIYATVEVLAAEDHPQLLAQVAPANYRARIERLFLFTVFCKNGDITNPELSGGKMPDAGRNMTWDLRAPAPTPSHLRATVAIKGSFRGAEF